MDNIAASLLPRGGRDMNSIFKLNIRDRNRSSTTTMKSQAEAAAKELAEVYDHSKRNLNGIERRIQSSGGQ